MNLLILQQNISQSQDCKNFYWHDSTLLWNSISSPNGYDPTGSVGFDPNNISITESVVKITKPDGTIVTIQLVSDDYDLTRLEDTGTNLIQKTISYTDLGFSDKLADGIYTFNYRLKDIFGVLHLASCYIVQDCTICCCLDGKLKDLTLCSDCNNSEIQDLFNLYMRRDSARMLAACGDLVGAQQMLDYITKLCNSKKCSSC